MPRQIDRLLQIVRPCPSDDDMRRAYSLLLSLYNDSETKMDFLRLVKKKYPHASMPELDQLHEEKLKKAIKEQA